MTRKEMGRWGKALLAGVLVLAALTGCADYQRALERSSALALSGEYGGALAVLEKSSLARSDKNRLLFLMEKGLLLHLGGEYALSNEAFEEADQLVEQLFTRSLSAETLSFVTNDHLIAYSGADYETVYLNYYKALNFINMGDLEGARIESRKIDQKLNYFADTFGSGDRFKESAYLRLLTGLIYEALGENNDAFIAYRKSLELYQNNYPKYGVREPDFLWNRLLISARRSGLLEEYRHYLDQAEGLELTEEDGRPLVAVIVASGMVPIKQEVFALFPTSQGFPVKLALPEFVDRKQPVRRLEVSVDGENWVRPERVEDVEKVARASLEDRNGRILAKAIARATAKQVAARQVEKNNGPLAGLAMQITALVTERADLRSWSMLPAEIHLALLPAPEDSRQILIREGQDRWACRVRPAETAVRFVTLRLY
ncbi:hypothetical protein [Desulfuromonas sp. AOP6]|uniref:COG3014 family protein n=1 Tax=Desulfuromonas sp. AOP6 TaxID=1566351 RepID=UPI00127C2A4B|nr:hypothetical protein [Desulfuromonas sp. AOP6]BCA80164.1 hypothetical protein AOP6_1951 [Desulfuromonas sp. AOP6]